MQTLTFPLYIEPPTHDGEVWAIYIPDLPNCFSAADKEEDILPNAKEAITSHLQALSHVPTPETQQEAERKLPNGYKLAIVEINVT